jgi:hypothetical protein
LFLSESYERVTSAHPLAGPAAAPSARPDVINFFNNGSLGVELANTDKLVEHVDSILSCVSSLFYRMADIVILVKLKMFYLGGLLDQLCDVLKSRITDSNNQKTINREVNDQVFKLLGKCNMANLTAAMSDDFELKDLATSPGHAPMHREFFRQWKYRLTKFFNICSIEKKLLFTDLSLSFIVRNFPDVASTKIIFDSVKDEPGKFPEWLRN